VLRRVVPFEPLDEAPRLQGRECLVEWSGGVSVEVVLQENNQIFVRGQGSVFAARYRHFILSGRGR
jgi:hypothetical protein